MKTEQTATAAAGSKTTFCPKCKANVYNSRIPHHRTWCNPELVATGTTPKHTLTGKIVLLTTRRSNGIQPMAEVVKDEGRFIVWRGLFGGRKLHRSKRERVYRVLNGEAK